MVGRGACPEFTGAGKLRAQLLLRNVTFVLSWCLVVEVRRNPTRQQTSINIFQLVEHAKRRDIPMSSCSVAWICIYYIFAVRIYAYIYICVVCFSLTRRTCGGIHLHHERASTLFRAGCRVCLRIEPHVGSRDTTSNMRINHHD